MAYGTVLGVASYCGSITNTAGEFDSDTIPKYHHVTAWLNQVSALMDTALAKEGFTTPVTEATSVLALTNIIEQLVTDLCMWANRAGRFYTERSQQYGVSPWKVITNDILMWVDDNAPGLESNGVPRSASEADTIAFREQDEANEDLFPIFQRKGFGNVFEDWTGS